MEGFEKVESAFEYYHRLRDCFHPQYLRHLVDAAAQDHLLLRDPRQMCCDFVELVALQDHSYPEQECRILYDQYRRISDLLTDPGLVRPHSGKR